MKRLIMLALIAVAIAPSGPTAQAISVCVAPLAVPGKVCAPTADDPDNVTVWFKAGFLIQGYGSMSGLRQTGIILQDGYSSVWSPYAYDGENYWVGCVAHANDYGCRNHGFQPTECLEYGDREACFRSTNTAAIQPYLDFAECTLDEEEC